MKEMVEGKFGGKQAKGTGFPGGWEEPEDNGSKVT